MTFKILHIKAETHKKLREYIAKNDIRTYSEGINYLLGENDESFR